MSDLRNTIESFQEEYIERDRMVTCEFSLRVSSLNKFKNIVEDINKNKFVTWVVYKCDTCIEQHGPGHYHAEIAEKDYIDKCISKDSIIYQH